MLQFQQQKSNKDKFEIFLFIIIFLVFESCSNGKIFISHNSANRIKGFNSRKWKKDSLSCNNQRPVLVKALISNKQSLINLNREQIIDLLGKPNGENKNTLGYFIESGTQCLDIKHIDYKDVQTKLLLISFANGLADDLYIIYP